MAPPLRALPSPSTHLNPRGGPHASAGLMSPAWAPTGPPNAPARICAFPSPLRGAVTTPRQDPKPLEGPQRSSKIPERSEASNPLGRTPNPHIGPAGRLNTERDTWPSARPRVPQSSQSPQTDPSPLGASLDPLGWISCPSVKAPPSRWLPAHHVAGGSAVR